MIEMPSISGGVSYVLSLVFVWRVIRNVNKADDSDKKP